MQRWIVVAIGIGTAVLAAAYQHWVVLAGAVVLTLFVLFRNPKFEPSARAPRRGFSDSGDSGDNGDGGD